MNGLNRNKPYGFGVLVDSNLEGVKIEISDLLEGILNNNGCDTKLWYDQHKPGVPKTEDGKEYLLLQSTRPGCEEKYPDIVAQFKSEHPEFADKVFVVEKDPFDAYREYPVKLPDNRAF